jgi:hypothetical protein
MLTVYKTWGSGLAWVSPMHAFLDLFVHAEKIIVILEKTAVKY